MAVVVKSNGPHLQVQWWRSGGGGGGSWCWRNKGGMQEIHPPVSPAQGNPGGNKLDNPRLLVDLVVVEAELLVDHSTNPGPNSLRWIWWSWSLTSITGSPVAFCWRWWWMVLSGQVHCTWRSGWTGGGGASGQWKF